MIKIIKKSTWNNIQGELERLRTIERMMKQKGVTAEDFRTGRVHIHYSPGKMPRTDVRAMMAKERAA